MIKEFQTKLENLSEQKDFNMVDQIHLFYSGDEEVKKAIKYHQTFIQTETIAQSIEDKVIEESFDINGHEVTLDIVVVK